ncbi:MAG: DUF1622 domain-containing protein [Proteobacteria bacterium]|nr:DUF1622 domain-containing protein [Pseudomonadota bacterium]
MLIYLVEFFEYAAEAIDIVGIIIVLIGAIKFVVHAVPIEIKRLRGIACARELRHLRLQLGSYIVLAIEFMIVSDIINTVLTKTMEDLYYLIGLIIARTAISYFLGKELTEIEAAN